MDAFLYKWNWGMRGYVNLRPIIESNMVHHFGLSCLCRDETFQVQCRCLFYTDEGGWDAVWRMVNTILGGGRHWCDGFVYEAVICPMVDILDSKVL